MKKETRNEDVALLASADEFQVQVARFEIASADDMTRAVEFLSELNKTNDKIVAEREKVTKPLNAALTAERARWKPTELKLTTAIAAMRSKISAWQTEQKRKADAEAEKIAARVGEGKGKLKPETASDKIAAIDTPAEAVSTESGQVKFRTVVKFELEDITKVPAEFLLLNETKVRTVLKENTRIPGLRYWEEEMPINLR